VGSALDALGDMYGSEIVSVSSVSVSVRKESGKMKKKSAKVPLRAGESLKGA
jgi:hypothetical protein